LDAGRLHGRGGKFGRLRADKGSFLHERPAFDALLEKLVSALIAFFRMQIEAGPMRSRYSTRGAALSRAGLRGRVAPMDPTDCRCASRRASRDSFCKGRAAHVRATRPRASASWGWTGQRTSRQRTKGQPSPGGRAARSPFKETSTPCSSTRHRRPSGANRRGSLNPCAESRAIFLTSVTGFFRRKLECVEALVETVCSWR